MTAHIKQIVRQEEIEIHHVGQNIRKETFVSALLKKRGEQEGLVCIWSAMEGCSCFNPHFSPI